MTLKIERNVPVPQKRGEISAVLRRLKPGESVLLSSSANSASSIARYAIGSGKFLVRAEGNGARVWRTK